MTEMNVTSGDTPNRTPAEMAALLKSLSELRSNSGSNQHEQAINVITACIEEGIDTSHEIVGVMARVGFDWRHVRINLKKNCGQNRETKLWWQDDVGAYHLHNAA